MKQTQNYSLNQYEPGDSFLRTDFNADNEKIDAALEAIPKLQWGQYNGSQKYDNVTPQDIVLGYRPRMVLIMPDTGAITSSGGGSRGGIVFEGQTDSPSITLTDTGFRVWNSTKLGCYPNDINNQFTYLAVA